MGPQRYLRCLSLHGQSSYLYTGNRRTGNSGGKDWHTPASLQLEVALWGLESRKNEIESNRKVGAPSDPHRPQSLNKFHVLDGIFLDGRFLDGTSRRI